MSIPEAVSPRHVHGIDLEEHAHNVKTLIIFVRVYRIQASILIHSYTRTLAARDASPCK